MDQNTLNNMSDINGARNFNADAAHSRSENTAYTSGYYYAPPGYAPQAGCPMPTQNGFYYAPSAAVKPPKRKQRAMIITIICLILVAVMLISALFYCAALILKNRTVEALKELDKKTQEEDTRSYYTEQISDEDRPTPENAPVIDIQDIPDTDELSTEQIVARVKPCVVGILTYKGQASKTLTGGGSGIIISQDGYIVTNAHVVSDTTALEVILDDGSAYTAVLAGIDIKTDLAVIKIDAQNLPVAEFGDSDNIQVGGMALAIGNPGGLSNTVTQGIFSGLNREISLQLADSSVAAFSLIQTDAAINPGNSGGALVNKYGQVVGINSAKITSLQYEGLGFAIPINVAKPVIDQLIVYGSVTNRVRLGITASAVGGSIVMSQGENIKGLYIESIEDDSPLKGTDITEGDIIVSIDGEKIEKLTDLSAFLAKHKPGDEIIMRVYKQQTGQEKDVAVILAADDE